MISHVPACPLPGRWPRSSWRPAPPMWRAVTPAHKYDLDKGSLFASWSEIVAWVDQVLLPMPWTAHPNTLVFRDDRPSWELLCLACQAVLSDADEPSGLRSPDRDELIRIATRRGWQGVEQHWLCPTCADGAGS